MESMDHDHALSILGLATAAGSEDIEASYLHRRDVLERRFESAATDAERRRIAADLEDLEQARHALDTRAADQLPLAGERISLKNGLVLADRYVVRDRIGAGPRAAVYRALDLKRGKEVALKVIAPHLLLIPGAFKRLSKAIKRVAILAHPNVCRTLGLVRAAGHTAIVMELVEGNNLESSVAARESRRLIGRGMTATEILSVLRSLAAALIYSRMIGPHRNLVPANVILLRGGGVKVTDYAIDRTVPLLAGHGGGGASAGECFRAPEIRQIGAEHSMPNADSRADQYSLAALSYFMATAEAPGASRSDLRSLRPDLPAPMAAAIERALSIDPEARYSNTSLFLSEMSRAPRGGMAIAKWLGGAVVAVTVAVGSLLAIGPRPFIATAVWPVMQWLPGGTEMARDRSETLVAAQRVERMRANLQNAQTQLQSRLDAGARQAKVMSDAPLAADWPDPDPRLKQAMLQALHDLVTPNVFNSPAVINTGNLLDIARAHIAEHRYAEARTILQAAETALQRKTFDLGQAERVVESEFGTPMGFSFDEGDAAIKARELRLQESWAKAIAARRAFAEEVDRSTVRIPAGTFIMGDQTGSGSRSEQPQHPVRVQTFNLGRNEVTRGEYAKCVAAEACQSLAQDEGGNPDLPAINVSWNDASAYVAWLSRATGETYRLPSEAEWEYAARAGTSTRYPWGDAVVAQLANCRGCGAETDVAGPAPVGSYAANAFGLNDMIGNVWEWTEDCWYRDYTSAPADATPRSGNIGCEYHVVRGGSWDNDAWLARVSYRAFGAADAQRDLHGFRIAKSAE